MTNSTQITPLESIRSRLTQAEDFVAEISNIAIATQTMVDSGMLDPNDLMDAVCSEGERRGKSRVETAKELKEAIKAVRKMRHHSEDPKPVTSPESEPPKQLDEWGAPTPFDEYKLPKFPAEVFPRWAKDFVEALSIATQTPICASGLLILAVLASCVSRKYKINIRENWSEPLNLYCVVVLASANRKTAVVQSLTRPIVEFEKNLIDSSRADIARMRAQYRILEERVTVTQKAAARATGNDRLVAENEAKKAAEEFAKAFYPPDKQLICDDVTPEQLATLLIEQNGRMTLFSDEGTIIEIMKGRYSNGSSNLEVYLKSHVGSPLRINRRGRSEYIENPALTIGVAVQQDVLSGLAGNSEFRGRGLLGRIFYAIPHSLIGGRDVEPASIPGAIEGEYARRIKALLELESSSEVKLTLSREALQELVKFARNVESELREGGRLGDVTDWGGKLVGGVARIAGLLHLAECPTQKSSLEIQSTTVIDAVKIGEYLIPHARAAYSLLGTNPATENAKFILRWIKREFSHREKEEQLLYSKREIYRAARGRFKTPDDVDPALNLLVSHEYFRPMNSGADNQNGEKRGRKPSAKYLLNPLFPSSSDLDTMDTMDRLPENDSKNPNVSNLSIVSKDQEANFRDLLSVATDEDSEVF